MNCIQDIFISYQVLSAGKPASEKEIQEAEHILETSFSKEYYEYLKKYGFAIIPKHELTGISAFPRIDVVNITIAERNLNPKVSREFYVIEQAHIDGIVIWQNRDGIIYKSIPGSAPQKIAVSLKEYLEQT